MSERILAAFGVLVLLTSACVRDKQPEPGIRAISTDLQYRELQEQSAAPPNTVPVAQPAAPPPAPAQPDRQPELTPPPTLPPFKTAPVGPVAPPAPQVCPTAAPTEQAQEDVTLSVRNLPVAGEYLWKVNGSEKVESTRLSLPKFTKRTIENVEGSGSDFTFETKERELSASNAQAPFVRSFFDVTATSPTDNTVRPGAGLSSGRTSVAGVRLVKVEREVPGGATTTFTPTSPIRYLITPVLLGPERFWQDVVLDSTGSQTLTHRAYVEGRITIDACGKRLRGWKVIAEQTYAREGETITRHFEYAVATQMGGIVIYERVLSPCTWDEEKKACTELERPALAFEASFGKAEG